MALRAIIFDLGGTLIDWPDWDEDTLQRWGGSYDALKTVMSADDSSLRETYIQAMIQAEMLHWHEVGEQQTSSSPVDILRTGFQILGKSVSEQALLAALDGYAHVAIGQCIIFSDAVETLLELRRRGYKLGLLSNTWWAAAWHDADLATHGLSSLLDVVFYSSDLPYSKPHPEAFLTVTRALDVAPEECVMVGDRLDADIVGGLGVGMRAVWKKTDYPWPEPEDVTPTAVITDLAELLSLLESW